MPNTTIVLHGDVGNCGDGFDFFTAADVIAALDKVGSRRATIRLNSGGGIATEGVAIAAAMRAHTSGVDVIVEGIAASAASIVAVSGSSVQMTAGSVFMIHEPAAITIGDADSHTGSAAMLNALGDSYAKIYAAKTDKSVAAVRKLMKAETWMTAEEAVAEGFADGILGQSGSDAVAPFAYSRYRHPPARLAALSRSRGWDQRKKDQAARAASMSSMVAVLKRRGVEPVRHIPTADLRGRELSRAMMANQVERNRQA